MAKKRSVTACVKEIKAINARFRTLKNEDGPLADKLRNRKDALIDEMAALCPHPSLAATAGARNHGLMKVRVSARRICQRCGCCELLSAKDRKGALAGRLATVMSVDDYAMEQGRILKRLGINI